MKNYTFQPLAEVVLTWAEYRSKVATLIFLLAVLAKSVMCDEEDDEWYTLDLVWNRMNENLDAKQII